MFTKAKLGVGVRRIVLALLAFGFSSGAGDAQEFPPVNYSEPPDLGDSPFTPHPTNIGLLGPGLNTVCGTIDRISFIEGVSNDDDHTDVFRAGITSSFIVTSISFSVLGAEFDPAFPSLGGVVNVKATTNAGTVLEDTREFTSPTTIHFLTEAMDPLPIGTAFRGQTFDKFHANALHRTRYTYKWEITVRDESQPPVPPTAAFDFSPAEQFINQDVTFVSTSTDSDGEIIGLEWDFGDGNGVTTTPELGGVIGHSYAQGGRYVVVLTATDNDGLSDSFGRAIFICDPPSNIVINDQGTRDLLFARITKKTLEDGRLNGSVELINTFRFFIEVTTISEGPFSINSLDPNVEGGIPGLFAERRLIPPCQLGFSRRRGFRCSSPGTAEWIASFCTAGIIQIEVAQTFRAMLLTMGNGLLGDLATELTTLIDIVEDLREVPLFEEAARCFERERGKFRCAGSTLFRLALRRNREQLRRMAEILGDHGIDLALGQLVRRVIRGSVGLFQIASDEAVWTILGRGNPVLDVVLIGEK